MAPLERPGPVPASEGAQPDRSRISPSDDSWWDNGLGALGQSPSITEVGEGCPRHTSNPRKPGGDAQRLNPE